ncbi:MAG TPA: hypothetical protein VK760_10350 [Candidatus Acidoferrales bacterium]|nr:hypothetical protein [Candidatus Acidoferrales bacterium]
MPEPVTSTGTLSPDARRSYETLGRNAELLGSLSASFSREARLASDTYRQALSTSTPDAWAECVAAADTLTRHTQSVISVVELNDHERKAREFFEQIVSENADLLTQRVPAIL